MLDILSKSKTEEELDRNLNNQSDEDRDLTQRMFAVYQDVERLAGMTRKNGRKKFEPQNLNLDASKQLIDSAFQLRELMEYIPNLEQVLENEVRKPTAQTFVTELKKELEEEAKKTKIEMPRRLRNITKAKEMVEKSSKSYKDATNHNQDKHDVVSDGEIE